MHIAIRSEHLSKEYRLGTINNGMLFKDLQSWLARRSGKPDPHEKIGMERYDDLPDRFWALKDLSFEIEQGERVGVIGRNGAGKSTLLKILSRITAPTEGRVRIKGRVVSLLEVGTGFHPELTGRENIFLNGAILGMKRRQVSRKLDEIIAFSEIAKFIDTPVKRYSSGMYVRLAFSVAAHLDSDILLADEVLAVGDATFQKKCLGKMEDVSKNQGRTVLFVSHNMGAVRGLCKSIMLLRDGRMVDYAQGLSLVSEYYGTASENKLISEWGLDAAPRSGAAILRRVEVLDAGGARIETVPMDKPFQMRISFTVAIASSVVGFTLLFVDEDNQIIFSAMGNTRENRFGEKLEKGDFCSSCIIPGNLLNNIKYRISVLAYSSGYSDAIRIDDVLVFKPEEEESSTNGFWGEIKGSIRPAVQWHMSEAGR
jgi:lipopolysaccharide transport system ATP-binding protein